MGFRLTGKSGLRRSGGSGRSAGSRVNAAVQTKAGLTPRPAQPAFSPDAPQDHSRDADNSPHVDE
jgi:hypothetical protein